VAGLSGISRTRNGSCWVSYCSLGQPNDGENTETLISRNTRIAIREEERWFVAVLRRYVISFSLAEIPTNRGAEGGLPAEETIGPDETHEIRELRLNRLPPFYRLFRDN
jgi:hypothetical protein